MSETLAIAEKLLAEATAEQDKLAELVRIAEQTLVKRRGKLCAAQARVRTLHADISALKQTRGHLKVVS